MSTQYVPASSGSPDAQRICIMGEPGTGKTRLAATFPSPLFLDIERGASTASANGVERLIIPTDRQTLKTVRDIVQNMAKAPFEDGVIKYPVDGQHTIDVGTLVIDSVDAIQQPVKMFEILRGRSKMERSDWDTLLNKMTPLVLNWNALPINVVVIAHTKRVDGENGKPGTMDFSVQGSLRTQMPRWFSLILHIVAGPDGKRFVVTRPMIAKGYRYVAKDRHGALSGLGKNGIIDLQVDDAGYPSDEIAQAICTPRE